MEDLSCFRAMLTLTSRLICTARPRRFAPRPSKTLPRSSPQRGDPKKDRDALAPESTRAVSLARAAPRLAPRSAAQHYRADRESVQPSTNLPNAVSGFAVRWQHHFPGGSTQLGVQHALDGTYVLTGLCRSYYVKQVVQHMAMTRFADGRVVNQIRVFPPH